MNMPDNELATAAELKAAAETYLETLMKMPLNRLLYEVLFGTANAASGNAFHLAV
jgi:hypothetical protein